MPTLEQLQTLIRNNPSSNQVLTNVAEPPIVNSFDARFKDVVSFIDLIPTPGKESYSCKLKKGDNVIYWKSAENDVGVEVIGIVWDENGHSKTFCGTILPP